jgi:hypothetical protein
MRLVNLGCGQVYHPAWTNLDIQPVSRHVRRWDVSKGLPFGEAEVDACYASHVIEHLRPSDARALLQECRRVLRRGGVIRLAVPDLETIAREYVTLIERADKDDPEAICDHEWMTIELLDQLVRTEPGGRMYRYLTSGAVRNPQYVIARVGLEAESLMKQPSATVEARSAGTSLVELGRRLREASSLRHEPVRALAHIGRYLREEVTTLLCGLLLGRRGQQAVREGLFRQSGEVHHWMYDRVSLKHLLEQCGFGQVHVCTAFESRIEGFASFDLDVVTGRVRKPDSLFMEAVKP